MPTKPRIRISASIGYWVARMSPATLRLKILLTSRTGPAGVGKLRTPVPHQQPEQQRQQLGDEQGAHHSYQIDARSFAAGHPGQQHLQQYRRMIADEPARTTIRPTATATLARAIPANGGPKGAPGQTARMRKPAATAGLASNQISSAIATSGTNK